MHQIKKKNRFDAHIIFDLMKRIQQKLASKQNQILRTSWYKYYFKKNIYIYHRRFSLRTIFRRRGVVDFSMGRIAYSQDNGALSKHSNLWTLDAIYRRGICGLFIHIHAYVYTCIYIYTYA